MESFVKYFLRNRAFTQLLLILTLLGGIFAYVKMGKLEDAPFTIKQAVVLTAYPGASPYEVQEQVTDVLEEAIQSLGELYYLETENRVGLSKITVYVKKEIRAPEMQQLWDKLRRKVSDAQRLLPQGVVPSKVNDDFGDVLGVFYGLSGEGYSYRELEEQAQLIKNDLLTVQDVAKVELFGIQQPTIDVVLSPSMMAQTGITTIDLMRAFDAQNKIVDAGAIESATNRIRIEPTGNFTSLEEIENIPITTVDGSNVILKDIATVEEGYQQPTNNRMKINNVNALGIAVSTVPTGNVVTMAELVKERIEYYKEHIPTGMELTTIYDQGYESAVANDGFIINLIISVITVVAVLLFFIGMKNGLLVGSGLVFSIFATLIYMQVAGIALQRMSLAAIIIAMGMLVDNAIVVSDSILVNMQRGMRKRIAIMKAVSSNAMPLLAATIIAILTFLPVYLSPHVSGELLSSLFIVIAVSLMASWVFALVQTPFHMEQFIARPRNLEGQTDPNSGKIYDYFRKSVEWSIRYRTYVVVLLVGLLIVSGYSFQFIPKVFLPQLNKQYFTIDMWSAEGSKIQYTDSIVKNVVDYLKKNDEVKQVASFVGQTPPRYYLANAQFGPQSNYAQALVEAHSPEEAMELQEQLYNELHIEFPELFLRVNKFELSSVPQALIEARFCGPDEKILDSLTNLALEIMRKNPKVMAARNEWGNQAMKLTPIYDPIKAGRLGMSKASMMESLKSITDGTRVGVYRDNDKQVPIVLQSIVGKDLSQSQLADFSVWKGEQSVPLSQVTSGIDLSWEYPLVKTYNRELTMAAMCDVKRGHTMKEVHSEIRKEIEAINIPYGYSFFWDSQFKDQKEGMEALTKYFPLAVLFLILILVGLFKNYRQPLIIFLILPLSLIGMVLGLLLTGFDFGFFCIAGWLGLLGMIVKNVIVLIDEVNAQLAQGQQVYDAVVEATVSRARPVLMAAITTIFGMIPLLFDVVFGGMAATIIFGLTFATLLTLFVTPILYTIFYRIKPRK